jgi:hypothetical protein
MRPGHYTELFFMDEATALAAGHRPCMECQRERATEFKRLWNEVNEPVRSLVEMDEILRRGEQPGFTTLAALEILPNGAMVANDDHCYLVKDGETYRWSFEGYKKINLEKKYFHVLTPNPIVNILSAGFSIDLPS